MEELNLLAEFIENIQDKKRDLLQTTALWTRLFFKDNPVAAEQEFMTLLDNETVDQWLSFISTIAECGDGQIFLQATVSFRWGSASNFSMTVTPKTSVASPLMATGIFERDGKGNSARTGITLPFGGLRLFEILDRQPAERLLKCQNCGKIFLNTTKRHMKFCSSNCRSHYSMKKARQQV